jgi:hypothetical protein
MKKLLNSLFKNYLAMSSPTNNKNEMVVITSEPQKQLNGLAIIKTKDNNNEIDVMTEDVNSDFLIFLNLFRSLYVVGRMTGQTRKLVIGVQMNMKGYFLNLLKKIFFFYFL